MYTYVMLCGGTLAISIAVLWFIGNVMFVLRSEEAEGKIIGEARGSKSGWRPRVEFTTSDGQTVEFVDNSSASGLLTGPHALYQRFILKRDDSMVKVAYNPNNPTSARIKNFIHLQDNALMVFLFGIVFTLLGFLPAEFVNKLAELLQKLPF